MLRDIAQQILDYFDNKEPPVLEVECTYTKHVEFVQIPEELVALLEELRDELTEVSG